MRRYIALISFLVSITVIIAHDFIAHHHFDPDECATGSNHLSDNHEHRKSNNDHGQAKHFPLHQHVLYNINFFNGRNNISLNEVLEDSYQDLGSLSDLRIDHFENTFFTDFVLLINKPFSSFPFIIALNSTRGSPFIS